MNKAYWDQKYKENETGWDLGEVSPPLKEYFDQLTDRDLKILIPGSGNSHEAEYLWNNGFKNVHALDISEYAFENLKKQLPDFPKNQMLLQDFFELENDFDLILEQTFFCALPPERRVDYLKKMASLLRPSGKLVGLLFNIDFDGGPPFGGSEKEYRPMFENYFNLSTMEVAHNSVKPRANNELFFIAALKQNK